MRLPAASYVPAAVERRFVALLMGFYADRRRRVTCSSCLLVISACRCHSRAATDAAPFVIIASALHRAGAPA